MMALRAVKIEEQSRRTEILNSSQSSNSISLETSLSSHPGAGGQFETNPHSNYAYENRDYSNFDTYKSTLDLVELAVAETTPQVAPAYLTTANSLISSAHLESSSDGRGRFSAEQLGFRERLNYDEHLSEAAAHVDDQSDAKVDYVPATPARLPLGWRISGYIHNTYIVVETPEGMEILEQHILHERTLYERLLAKQTISGRTTEHGQRLLISAPLNLHPEQQAVLLNNSVLLERLGFEFESIDGNVHCVQVPLELAHKDYPTVIQEMMEQLSTTDSADLELEATKSIACQSAIKNGMPLGEEDLIRLIGEWYTTPRNDTCPHGRPVRLKFPLRKLFELFHPD
jgi:DNA mismatch repair ATPase MutL